MTEQEFREFEGRLENWCRGLRLSGGSAGHCGSVEGQYQCPSDRNRGAENTVTLVDVKDAWLIEDAWRTLLQPWAKWLIKWHYLYKASPHGVMRQLQKRCGYGLRRDRYDPALREAVSLLKKNVDSRARRSYSSAQQSDSSIHGETSRQQAAQSRPKEVKPATAR